ncbi:MAG: hypothetical protein EBQ95_03245 [Gammaproteobacteria bacterium]|nr:hypothetical protein [Gammaproteobacteria bacterium]
MIGQDLFEKKPVPFFLAGSYVTMAIVTPQEYYIIDSDGDFKLFNQRAETLPLQQIHRQYFYKALHLMSKFYLHEI